MHIVHVVRQYVPFKGGLEFAVHDLARTQAALGHSVRVVTLNRKLSRREQRARSRENIDGVEIIRIPFIGSSRYPLAPTVVRYLGGADIVHVHAIDFFFDYLSLMNVFLRKTLIVSTHGGFFHTSKFGRLKNFWFKTVTRFNVKRYAAVVSVSEQDYRTFSQLRRDGIKLIYNGIDVDKFANAASPRPVRGLFALSRFAVNKNIDQLLDVAQELNREEPWRLDIVGNSDDLSVDDIRKMIRERGLSDSVTVHTGLTNAEIRHLMGKSSLFVSASSYEGFGIAAVEALSAGLGLVLNDIKPYRDLKEAVGQGTIVDFSDTRATAQHIRSAFADLENSPAGVETGRAAAISRYSLPVIATQIIDLYNDCLGVRKRSILGMPTSVLSREQAVVRIDDLIGGGAATPVFFANANLATLFPRSTIGDLKLDDSLILNDGIGMDIASILLYRKPFPANLNGTDFLVEYLSSSSKQLRIFLLGGRPGVARNAAAMLSERFPRHRFVGHHHGYFEAGETGNVVDSIREAGANLLMCAMGNPKQEEWLVHNLSATGCDVGIGVGAFFDFVTEAIPRAPEWVRRWRGEWLYRLSQEPRRMLKRYTIGNIGFLISVVGQYLRGTRVI